jgi:hypothetical protein
MDGPCKLGLKRFLSADPSDTNALHACILGSSSAFVAVEHLLSRGYCGGGNIDARSVHRL